MPDDVASALRVARDLASVGVPLFVAAPDPSQATGFALPTSWQHTATDMSGGVVDSWRPGMALCAVMGGVFDLVDVDPRNGGNLDSIPLPFIYALATTPSAGVHAFVKSMGVRSRNNLYPGVDIKAGDREGKGRGFAFIAPTVRVSKLTGKPTPYRWVSPPDIRSSGFVDQYNADHTQVALQQTVLQAHGQVPVIPAADVSRLEETPSVGRFLEVGPWVDIARTLAGGRNDGVMRLAAALRGEGGMSIERALDYMTAKVWPLIDQEQAGHEFGLAEFEGIIRGVWDRYPDGRAARLDEAVDTQAERPPALAGVGLADAWFVDRIAVARLTGRFLWSRGLGWLRWDGRRWIIVDQSTVVDDVRQYIQWLYGSAAAAGADSDLLKRIATLGSRSRLAGLVELCRGVESVQVKPTDFDSHPDLLNCANGVVDLRTGALLAHDPELLFTTITEVRYVEGAEHADWRMALEAVPADVRAWWQLRIGQAATGHMTPDDLMVVQVGGGANGKTTLMSGICGALGDYYLLVSHRALLGSNDSVPTELMDFRGARLALLEETPEERRLAITKLKALVGTPQITARRMRQDPVTFPASHSLFVSTNYLPVVSETDHGTWRRLACVTFPYRWRKPGLPLENDKDRPGDPDLRARLIAGRDGQHEAVLAWIVAGSVAWYHNNLSMPDLPERVERDTLQWRTDTDVVLGYIGERLEFDPERHMTARDLLDDVNEWLVSRGHRTWSIELVSARFGGHSEFAAHHVIKKQIRDDGRRSRRPVRAGMVTESADQDRYTAWLGIKFRERTQPAREGLHDTESHDVGLSKINNPPPKSEVDLSTCTVNSVKCYSVPPGFSKLPLLGVNSLGLDALDRDQLEDQQRQSPKVSKSAAQYQQREALVREAAGPVGALPAAVNRDGVVTTVPLDLLRHSPAPRTLTVDVETTGYPVGHEHYTLRTIQLGDDVAAFVLDATDPEQREVAREWLSQAEILHAHSATADLVPLAHAGLVDYDEAWTRMRDTVLPAKLADPQSTGSDPGLKKLSEAVLGERAVSPSADKARAHLFHVAKWLTDTKIDTPLARSGWAQVDSACATMTVYAASDVLDTALLATELPIPRPAVLERERTAQRLTARVAYRGLRIDGAHVRDMAAEHTTARRLAHDQIKKYGIDNPGSDVQVAERLAQMGAELPRTEKGRLSVAADALEALRGSQGDIGDLVRARLDYQHHDKILSAFLTPYGELVTRGDGRVRPTMYTLGADTGRMSCVRPNLQQVPRTGGIRGCITADPGHLLISADFASVEVRVMAALSHDPALMRALANGLDVHGLIAEQVFGPSYTKSDRYVVKRGVFGWAYGGGITNLSKQIGVSESTMAEVVNVLRRLAPDYVQWTETVKQGVRGGHTQYETYSGRVIHLDPRFPHKAPNYLVQGTARELLVDALIRWESTPWGHCTLLPVHDELLVMVPEADAVEATDALVGCMQTALFGVAILAEASEPSFVWRDAA